jgi:hypothetical protein
MPPLCDADRIAKRAFNFLSNGMGAFDYDGLPVVAALLGVDDIEDLLERLLVIKAWRRPADRDPQPEAENADQSVTLSGP